MGFEKTSLFHLSLTQFTPSIQNYKHSNAIAQSNLTKYIIAVEEETNLRVLKIGKIVPNDLQYDIL